jgi:hypothetical protein
MTDQKEIKQLNTSFLDRRINWMKEVFRTRAEQIKKLINKSPYSEKVAELYRNLKALANTENGIYRSAQMSAEIGE